MLQVCNVLTTYLIGKICMTLQIKLEGNSQINPLNTYFVVCKISFRMAETVVTIKNGALKGKIAKDYKGANYYSFKGIPYAKSPVGPLRFKAPEPHEDWTGIRDAGEYGNVCGARDLISNQLCGSEDCLFINVYTPTLPTDTATLKPVMCWIHGGGFVSGSGNSDFYGPEYLITEDVVLVTFNYRLGILGFLSFDDSSLDVPGNAGLKDQVMALKWIQQNIANLGGDPNNVTIFGQSAGGVSVHLLMLSPLTSGLFHKAIIQSGNVFARWAMGKRTLPTLKNALKMEGTEKEFLKILRQMSFKELLELQMSIPDTYGSMAERPFCPVIENVSSKMPFLLEDPGKIMELGKYNCVPVMTGYTSREGIFASFFNKIDQKEPAVIDFEAEIPIIMKVKKGTPMAEKFASKIKTFYFGNEESSNQNRNQYYLLQADHSFVWPSYWLLRYLTTSSSKPVYLYRVSIETENNFFKKLIGETTPGACHGDELGYLFTNFTTSPVPLISTELKTMRRFTKLWANFAKTGNPNPEKLDTLINIVWEPAVKDQFYYLDIGENLTVGVNPDEDRVLFWDELLSLSSAA